MYSITNIPYFVKNNFGTYRITFYCTSTASLTRTIGGIFLPFFSSKVVKKTAKSSVILLFH